MAPKLTEIVAIHELDVAWIIAEWLYRHGWEGPGGIGGPGGPAEVSEEAELLVRALSVHLQSVTNAKSADIVERLAKQNVKVSVKVDNKKTEVKTTKEFHEHMGPDTLKKPHQICIKIGEWEVCRTIYITHQEKA